MTAEISLVSVIVNNYNYGRFLAEAIDSALSQTYERVEVIVVDDGSTDDSRDVIASYGDRIVPLLKANGGQASAFNAGFAASHGDLVIFLDADDALLPTAAARAIEKLEPGVVKVFWPLWEMDAEGRVSSARIPSKSLPTGDLREKIMLDGPVACAEVPTSGNAWPRHFLERVLPMPESEFRINGDCYLSTLAAIYGEVRPIEDPQARYRVHGENRYVLMSVGEKSRRQFEMYPVRCDLLALHLRRLGAEVDPARWKEGHWNFHYLQVLSLVTDEIAILAPEGASLIMIDDGQWGDGRAGSDAIPGRLVIPFMERDGYYNGRPEDDDAAIRELDRLRHTQAPQFLVVVWLAFWWLEYYSGFATHLRASFPCLLSNERLMIFDLRS